MEKKSVSKQTTKRLGRGIDSLIPQSDIPSQNSSFSEPINALIQGNKQIVELPIAQVQPNPNQPRKYFDENRIQELADSISIHGILEPLLVSKLESGSYSIIAGERRFRAAKIAKLKTVPSIILSLKEEEKIEIAIIENLQREDLNPIEIAQSFKNIMAVKKITQEEVAKKLSISRSEVANLIRLLTLPDEIQQALIEEKITKSHARSLLSVENSKKQKELFNKIIIEKISVKELESNIVQTAKPKKSKRSPQNDYFPIYEQKLIEFFGTKITISGNLEKGTITIPYMSQDDFQRVLSLLNITLD